MKTSGLRPSTAQLGMLLTLAAGCGARHVDGAAAAYDLDSSALSGSAVVAIEGAYGSACIDESGSWTIALNGYTLGSGETPLQVVLNDVGCSLSVTGVKVGSPSAQQSYQPATSVPLNTGYAALATAFLLNGTGPTAFYANFEVTPDLTFATNFVVQMLYSDDVRVTSIGSSTTYAVVNGSASAAVVPAPNATMSLAPLNFTIDANNIVSSASGSLTLTQGSTVAVSYVIDDTLGASPTFAATDAVFQAGTKMPLSGPSQSIPAASLSLIGLNLTTPQQVNVVAADILDGVNSYQVFELTFHL